MDGLSEWGSTIYLAKQFVAYGWNPNLVSNTWTPEQLVLMIEAAQENKKEEMEMYNGEDGEDYNDYPPIPRSSGSGPQFSRRGKHSDLAAGVLNNFLQRTGFLQKGE